MKSPSKEPIDLLKGQPGASLLPIALLKAAANTTLSDPNVFVPGLGYGPDPGYEPLRESIAAWLDDFYQSDAPIDAPRICITGGASQNLGCLLSVYTDPEFTRAVWIVAPGYFLAFRIFEDAGFGMDRKMRAVPEDEEGLDIDFLRREMEKSERQAQERGNKTPKYKPDRERAKVYKHVIYCVPTFANPSSRTMTLARRQDLVRLAREFDALVVADDVYDLLRWPSDVKQESHSPEASVAAPLPRLVDIDRTLSGGTERGGADGFGNACSNGSFSKLAGPGIRVGWVEGSGKFAYGISQTGTTCSGGAPSQLTSTYVNEMLSSGGLQNYINDVLRAAHASRYRILMRAIHEHLLPLGFSLPQTDRSVIGGYFAWLRLPSALKSNGDVLASRCLEEERVIIAPGSRFEVPRDSETVVFDRNVRLCWAYEDEWKLREGVKRIGIVVRKMLDEEENGDFVMVEKEGFKRTLDDFK